MMNGYNNNFGSGYPMGGPVGGYFYQEAPKLQMTQGLNPEQLKSLRKTSGFSLDISQDELWRSFCTHRTDNKFAVTQDDEGNYTCSLCGTKFKPFDGDVNEARDLVNKVVDLMETTKMQSLTLPQKTIQDFFQIEPVLKRLPDLYSQSMNDFRRATGVDGGYMYGQDNNAFAMYQNMINPTAGNGYYDPAMMGQPVYGAQPAPYAQPMYTQQPYQQQYAQPMYNQQPMYGQPYGQQPMQQQAQGNPFNVNSQPVQNNAQAPAAQAPATNNDQVTVSKKLTD